MHQLEAAGNSPGSVHAFVSLVPTPRLPPLTAPSSVAFLLYMCSKCYFCHIQEAKHPSFFVFCFSHLHKSQLHWGSAHTGGHRASS